jgi:preprotein translocase subunit YajC
MYIIAIAWIYVVLLMAVTEPTLTASIMTFLFYCVLPLTLFFYLIRTPQRKRMRQNEERLKSSISAQKIQEIGTDADVAIKEID